MSCLKDYIKNYTVQDIRKCLEHIVLDKKILNNTNFDDSINEMRKLVSLKNYSTLCINIKSANIFNTSYSVFVTENHKKMSIQQYTWEELLYMNISNTSIKEYGECKAVSIILYAILNNGLTQKEMSENVNKFKYNESIMDQVIENVGDMLGDFIIEKKEGYFHIWNVFATYRCLSCSGPCFLPMNGNWCMFNAANYNVYFKPDSRSINIPPLMFNEVSLVVNELYRITGRKIEIFLN